MFTKLFDLIPVIEKIDSFFGHDNSSIEALEGSGNNVFVGTSGGGIMSFSITESTSESGKVDIRAIEWAKTIVTQGRPVSYLKSASALNRLFALSDGSLHILTMQDLKLLGGPKSRSISCFALNESPSGDDPFLLELAFGTRRRQIVICDFSNDKFNTTLEVDTDDIPLCLAFDGRCVCYATCVHYYVLHLNNKSTRPLFPINSEQMVPIVKRIAKNEFLLNGLENLGIFATSEGASNRPPLFWSAESVKSIAHTYPNVISLSEQFISVHSLLDQQLKQQIPFTGGRFLDEIDGQLFVVSRRNVYKLNPVSWEKQVDSLLSDKLVDEALALAQTARKPGTSKEDFVRIFRILQQKAGFIKFEECKWEEAFELFSQSKVDVREVICLFPNLLPSSSNFVRSSPPLHNIPDVDFVLKRNVELKLSCKSFLLKFLLAIRSEPWAKPFLSEIDLAVLKLSTEIEPNKLTEIMTSLNILTDLNDFENWCKENKYFNAQASILWKLNRPKDALNIWMKLTDKELDDSNFAGLDLVFDLLSKSDYIKLIYDNFSWFFTRDMNKTVKLLSQCKEIDAEKVLDLLKNDQKALRIYLEYLVFDQNSKHEKFHTQLAELYLSAFEPNMNENDEVRKQFRQFLYSSSFYRVHYLMSKIETSPNMQYEKAILYGKMNEHAKAFDILIEKLKNYDAAEEYCINFCKSENREQRHIIYSTLLHTYLSNEKGDTFVAPVLQLLNSKNLDVDFQEVLKMLPSHWSLTVLTQFLRQSSVKHHESVSSSKLKVQLAQSTEHTSKYLRQSACNRSHAIAENDRCAVCQNNFVDATCVVYPDGTMVHKNCLKYKHLSPVTQNIFTTSDEK